MIQVHNVASIKMASSTFVRKYANQLAVFFLLLFVLLAASINKLDSIEFNTLKKDARATISGGCEKESSPYLVNNIEANARITYCVSGDAGIDIIETSEFYSTNNFLVYIAGYFNDNVKLVFEVDGEAVLPVNQLNVMPGEEWIAQEIHLPYSGKKRVKISLIDNGASFKEWGGLSVPTSRNIQEIIYQIKTVSWLFIFFVASVAITYLSYKAIKRFSQLEAVIAPSVFAFLCGIYYLSFWIYYCSHDLGLLFSYCIILISLFTLFRSILNGDFSTSYKASSILKIYFIPIFYVIVIFSFSMSYESLASIQKSTAQIFSHELPIDNFLPKILADQVYSGNIVKPMIGDWLSSDRPPLQAGQFLFFYKLFLGGDVGYQLNSMLLQAYVLVPIMLLLNTVFKTDSILKFAITISVAFSSVVLVNSVYVWPKLVAGAALLFVIYVLLVSGSFKNKTTSIVLSVILAMISMLAHSGSIFSLVPIAMVSFFVFKPNIKNMFLAIVTALVIFGPWVFYQKYIDPPGDRLVKWHLAGQVAVNNDSFSEAINQAYAKMPANHIFAAKVANFRKVFEGVFNFDYSLVPLKVLFYDDTSIKSINYIKTKQFFNFFYSMGIIFVCGVLSIAVLIFKRKRNFLDFPFSSLLVTSLVSLIIWCLLMFEPGSTVIHQGPYFPWLALILAFSMFIALAFEKFSLVIFALHFLINFSIYFVAVSRSQAVLNTPFILVFIIFLFAFVFFVYRFFKCVDSKNQEPV